MRLDVWLKKVLLLKSRSQAKTGCHSGKILLGGEPVKESHSVHSGERITLVYPRRRIEIEVMALPEGNVARKDAADYYKVLSETLIERELP